MEAQRTARTESIAIFENLLTEQERNYIKQPENLGNGNSMAIKYIDQKDWLMTNSEGIVDFDATVKKLTDIASILDRSK